VPTGKTEWVTLEGARPGVNGTVSPDGRVLPRSRGPLEAIELWDCSTGKRLRTLEESAGVPVYSVRWSADGKLLAVWSKGLVLVWQSDTGKVWRRLPWERCELCWSPRQRTLALYYDGTIHLWDIDSPRPRVDFQAQVEGWAPWWSPDGRVLVTGGQTGDAWFWDAATGTPLGRMVGMYDPHGLAAWLLVSPEGHYRLSEGADVDIVYVIATDGGQEVLTPAEMERRYGWRNDPDKARLLMR
jgi:WD40 repeat protein